MRRFALAALLLVALCIRHSCRQPLFAQSVSSADLAAAALSESDALGYTVIGETSGPTPAGFTALFIRTFASGDDDRAPVLVDFLLAPDSAVSDADLRASAGSEDFFRGVIAGANLEPQQFRLTGPLGIGDLDQSAVWDAAVAGRSATLRFYGDLFLRDRVVAGLLYAAAPDQADSAQLTTFAALQDAKLVASGLPALLAGPSSPDTATIPAAPAAPDLSPASTSVATAATPAPTRTPPATTPSPEPTAAPRSGGPHTWYTSSAANSTQYCCDDDPAWQSLSPRNLRMFATVAALLASYPGKHLNRPCLDGATGP